MHCILHKVLLYATPSTNPNPNANTNLVFPNHVTKFIVTSYYLCKMGRHIDANSRSRDLTNVAPNRLRYVSVALYTCLLYTSDAADE